MFFIHLLLAIAKFNETDRLNASRDQHSCFIEGLRPNLLEDGQDRWCHAFDRRLRRHLGFGVANGLAVDYGGRSIASFTFGIIMLAGDVCPNPGPRNVKDPCGICSKGVTSNQDGICCDQCNTWFHTRRQCLDMPKQTYDNYVININLEWICPQCYKSPLDVSQSDCPENTSISSPDMYEDLRTTLRNSGLKLAHINIRGLLQQT